MSESAATTVDYGLGTFKGQPLVLCTPGGHFHRHDHGGRYIGVTFTEEFASSDDGWERCQICWPPTDEQSV